MLLYHFLVFTQSILGKFQEISAESTQLPGIDSTFEVTLFSTQSDKFYKTNNYFQSNLNLTFNDHHSYYNNNWNYTWYVPPGCFRLGEKTLSDMPNIKFRCSKPGKKTNSFINNSYNNSLFSFDFTISPYHKSYQWYITFDETPSITDSFCHKSSLCYSNDNNIPFHFMNNSGYYLQNISIWIIKASEEEWNDEIRGNATFPSLKSQERTHRFYLIGEHPILTISGNIYDNFQYDSIKNIWKGSIPLSLSFPQPFSIHGNFISDHLGNVKTKIG